MGEETAIRSSSRGTLLQPLAYCWVPSAPGHATTWETALTPLPQGRQGPPRRLKVNISTYPHVSALRRERGVLWGRQDLKPRTQRRWRLLVEQAHYDYADVVFATVIVRFADQ